MYKNHMSGSEIQLQRICSHTSLSKISHQTLEIHFNANLFFSTHNFCLGYALGCSI
jgi:hypothetical protein